jgi:hypothetical protein
MRSGTVTSVNTTGLSDAPAETDGLGFAPYVRAVYRFLASKETKAPLTLSIEGRWGSGKSSFMLQLAEMLRTHRAGRPIKGQPVDALQAQERPKTRDGEAFYTIWFNAWRFDEHEALWAAFSLALIQQLNAQIPLLRRLWANIDLLWRRFDVEKGKWALLRIAGFVLAFGLYWLVAFERPDSIKQLVPEAMKEGAAAAGGIALLAWAAAKAKELFGNPLEQDLKRYVRDPQYHDRLSFSERFQEDLARILASYVGNGKVFVFIDDLDRADVPKAVDLMQAINILMSADQLISVHRNGIERARANLFFILGIDRQVIAAGIAAKHKKLVPYLAAVRSTMEPEIGMRRRFGIDYGYEFLEKFLHVSLRIPKLDTSRVGDWVSSLADVDRVVPRQPVSRVTSRVPGSPEEGPDDTDDFAFSPGDDPIGFAEVVARIAGELEFGPRRIKQFINVLRLQVLILVETGHLIPQKTVKFTDVVTNDLTLERIGIASAILIKWPALLQDLLSEPDLLSLLLETYLGHRTGLVFEATRQWEVDAALRAALTIGPEYSLLHVDLRPLLALVADSNRPGTAWRETGGERSRLVGTQAPEAGYGTSDVPPPPSGAFRGAAPS